MVQSKTVSNMEVAFYQSVMLHTTNKGYIWNTYYINMVNAIKRNAVQGVTARKWQSFVDYVNDSGVTIL